MICFRLIAVCLALAATAGASHAQATSVGFGAVLTEPDAPIELTADSLLVDQEAGTALAEGNVLVAQGPLRLTAPRLLIVNVTGGGIERIEATGGVTLASGPDAAEASRADYNVSDGLVVMTGDVRLTRGTSVLSSDRMTVNLVTGTARMGGRVQTILNPQSD